MCITTRRLHTQSIWQGRQRTCADACAVEPPLLPPPLPLLALAWADAWAEAVAWDCAPELPPAFRHCCTGHEDVAADANADEAAFPPCDCARACASVVADPQKRLGRHQYANIQIGAALRMQACFMTTTRLHVLK